VEHLQKDFKVSECRACRVVDQPRSSERYSSTKADIDTALMQRMVALSRENPRYGYRRVWALLRREGWAVNKKRVQRPCIETRESVWPPTRVIVGDDFSNGARKAGELTGSIGALYGSQILLIYAHPDLAEVPLGETRSAIQELYDPRERDESRLESGAGELEAILGSRPHVRLIEGYQAAVILKVAQQQEVPSLVAVGSRGLAGIRRTRLGSVSTKIVIAAPRAVLVCPHAEQG
jgi:nucleotide-binding universal stress UspA family protein